MGNAVIARENQILSAPKVLSDCLGKLPSAALIVFDSNTGRVFATTNATTKAALVALLANPPHKLELVPDGGQSGRFLTWHQGTKTAWTDYDYFTDKFSTAVKPKFSAYAIAYEIARAIGNAWSESPVVIIDQTGAKLTALIPSNSNTLSASLAAVQGQGDSIGVQLTPPSKPNFV